MRESLNKFYGFAKGKIVPNLRYSQYVYEDVLRANIISKSDWLDIGCGHQLLPSWCFEREKELIGKARSIVGVDYDFSSLIRHKSISQRVMGTADALPFKNEHFDIVTGNMVAEHLDKPDKQFAEINRVLKPEGLFIFHTVNERGYFALLRKIVPDLLVKRLARLLDGREPNDVFEVHYKANSENKIKRLAEKTEFSIEKIKFISSDAVFSLVAPLAVIELLWIKILMLRSLRKSRTNLIVVLRKKSC